MGKEFLGKWTEKAEHFAEGIYLLPIIEIAGDRRVLIENHYGIITYTNEVIEVNVKFGVVSICGYHLKLLRMTKEQLIIYGIIHEISISRRENS